MNKRKKLNIFTSFVSLQIFCEKVVIMHVFAIAPWYNHLIQLQDFSILTSDVGELGSILHPPGASCSWNIPWGNEIPRPNHIPRTHIQQIECLHIV